MLSMVILRLIILSVILQSVVMPIAFLLSVLAPLIHLPGKVDLTLE
jgi:hypothetical protein